MKLKKESPLARFACFAVLIKKSTIFISKHHRESLFESQSHESLDMAIISAPNVVAEEVLDIGQVLAHPHSKEEAGHPGLRHPKLRDPLVAVLHLQLVKLPVHSLHNSTMTMTNII